MAITNMKSYDIVIIGAGPAGLKCAEVLGGSKLEVLVLDKEPEIGPKVCAGGLTALDSSFEIPSNKCISRTKQKFILNNKEYEIDFAIPLRTIGRFDLGQYQLGLVSKFSNITIQKKTRVVEINEKYVLTDKNQKVFYKKLVGADGSISIVRNFLGLENRIYVGIQYIIPRSHEGFVWFLNPELMKSSYGWIFPHKKFTSAGLYFNPKLISAGNARKILDQILTEYGLDFTDAKFESAPINTCFRGLDFGNILIVGDAAGLVAASTGEGISYAMSSGYDVGRYILDPTYKFEKTETIMKYKRRQEFVQHVFDMCSVPFIQNLMFKALFRFFKYPGCQKFAGV